MSPTRVYGYVAGTLLLWMLWSAFYFPLFEYAPHEDFWEHAAAIKEWSVDLLNPANPQVASDAGSSRYTPFSLLFVSISMLLGMSAIDVLELAAFGNTLLFVLGTFLFLRSYFRNEWAPVIGLIVFIGLWGTGFRSAGEHQLRTLFYVASYPSMFSFGLGLVSFWLALKIVRGEVSLCSSLASLSFLVAVSVLSHPLEGAFVVGGIAMLCVTEQGAERRFRIAPIVAGIGGVVVAEFWPMFSILEVVLWKVPGDGLTGFLEDASRVEALEDELNYFFDLRQVITALGPALLGIPCVLYLALARRHPFLVYGFLLMAAPYTVNVFWAVVPLGHRFVYFAVFYLHMALVWLGLRGVELARKQTHNDQIRPKKKALAAMVAITLFASFLWNVTYAAAHFGYTYFRKEPVPVVMKRLSPFLKEDSVVLAPLRTAWPIPSFQGKVVGLLGVHAMVPDDRRRSTDVAAFFEADISNERRLEILKRYNVSHVLFEASDVSDEIRSFLQGTGSKLGSVIGYCNENNVDEIKEDWKKIFSPCQKSMIEVYGVQRGSVLSYELAAESPRAAVPIVTAATISPP